MKRAKRMMILVAILVVACIATFALSHYEQTQEQIQNSDAILLEIPASSVTALSWEYSTGDGLAFDKTEEGWKYQEDEAFPVSEEKVNDILSHFEAFGVSFIIENVTDYSQYGLDEPECTLHLSTGETSYDIKLGDFSKMDQQRYIDIGDGSVYLVSEDPMDYVDSALSSMILHDNTPELETVTDISFTGAENYTIVRNDEGTGSYNSEDIYLTEQNGSTVPLDTASVQTYLSTVASLGLVNYVTYNATEEDLQTYGLDEPELSVTIRYSYTDENEETMEDTFVLHISENPQERAAAEESETETTVTKYVRIGDSQIIYTIDSTDYAILRAAAYDDLRHEEVFWADFDTVIQIDVSLEGETHILTSAVNDEEETVWHYGETELEIGNLQTALEALNADGFTGEPPTGVQEISLTIHLDNENFPETRIELYRYDGSFCIAVVDGEPVSMVSRSGVMDLVEAVQAIVLN